MKPLLFFFFVEHAPEKRKIRANENEMQKKKGGGIMNSGAQPDLYLCSIAKKNKIFAGHNTCPL